METKFKSKYTFLKIIFKSIAGQREIVNIKKQNVYPHYISVKWLDFLLRTKLYSAQYGLRNNANNLLQ